MSAKGPIFTFIFPGEDLNSSPFITIPEIAETKTTRKQFKVIQYPYGEVFKLHSLTEVSE